jgi:hypothetical protein
VSDSARKGARWYNTRGVKQEKVPRKRKREEKRWEDDAKKLSQ